MKKKILVADHHPIVVEGVTNVLNSCDNFTKIKKNVLDGKELDNYICLYYPDILLLDMDLPNLGGVEGIRRIKKSYRFLKVLVFSVIKDNNIALNYIRVGASGILCKTEEIKNIVFALERVSKGGIYLNEVLRKELNQEHDEASLDINSIKS